ncbi:aminotransferase class IV [Streptomyces canus]|uniref:aminotransferase class IV n=1 Tax=Streptomyces canus TaxID=58343 RepID=UPI000380F178|nr:aminotransferase class IV [Streptomyces canus]
MTAHNPGNPYLWRSGRIVPSADATVHVRAVGHASVSAVFEGINAYWSDTDQQLYVFRLRDHLQRLLRSAQLSYLTVSHTVDELESATLELLRRNEVRGDVHIRPWCFIDGNPIEQMVPEGAKCEVVIDSWAFNSALSEPRTRKAAIASWERISGNSMPPQVKAFANYHNGRLGNIDAQRRGADWPIFLNSRNQLTESSGATIGMFSGGVFHTPGLDSGILDGVTRATVLDLLSTELGVPVQERAIERSDAYLADEFVFVGTSSEVLPIVEIDGHVIGDGDIGPLTARLRAEYESVLRGRRPARAGWLTPVWPGGAGNGR